MTIIIPHIRGTLVKQTQILLTQSWCIWEPKQIHAVAAVN